MINFLKRKYYIYPEIQKPLIKFVVTSIIIVSALQSLLIFFSMRWLENTIQADISIVVDYRVLGPWKNLLYFSVLIPMFMNIVLGFFFLLFVSNRFAGPLFRLERELDYFISGDKKVLTIQFRDHDYLHSLARKINGLQSVKSKSMT